MRVSGIKSVIVTFIMLFMVFYAQSMAAERHYVSGVEGLKAATLPPPGLYGRLYGVHYTARRMMDADRDKLDIGFDLNVFAIVPRVIWISEHEILGGNYFADIVVPLVRTDLSVDVMGVDEREYGLGDICLEPLGITWHGPRYDAVVALGGYIPVGKYNKRKDNASPGKDMWTAMLTLGGTAYADADKTWHASVLSRYEIHSRKDRRSLRPGDDFHFEWGLGKTLNQMLDIGAAGYCYWQVTRDQGRDRRGRDRSRVFAAGPEANIFIPGPGMFLSARLLWEFGARSHTEGTLGAITLTRRF